MPPTADAFAELLDEAKQRVAHLKTHLPVAVDPLSFGHRCKTPYVLMCVREAQAFRAEEFARNASDCFERGDNVVGVTNTRGLVESLAVIYYIRTLMLGAIKDGVTDGLHNISVRLIVGSKSDEALPPAINILTMLDKVEKDIPGFRSRYDRMSEFAHPNWGGALGVFGKRDSKTLITYFGRNLRENSYAASLGLQTLCAALATFEGIYNSITDLMPAFTDACEKALPPPGGDASAA